MSGSTGDASVTDVQAQAQDHARRDPHPGQWRLSRVELINWGTFEGHHVLDVARRGHLITGHSGSGKSSLLDAIATVLTPKRWLRFNTAAQDASSRTEDRSLVSYIRGAWSRQTDDETGEGMTRFLRAGATWSAIQLVYSSGDDGDDVNLLTLFHLARGSNRSGDVRDVHVVRRGRLSAIDAEPFARSGIEQRRLKAAWPDAHVTDKHAVFAARFVRLLGIGHEGALQLLHRTQAAKSLGSLDGLFRTFMLDEPTTSDLADTAVAEFGELAEAHRVVVEARRQAEHLRRLGEPAEAYDAALADIARLDTLLETLDDYRDRRLLDIDRIARDRLRADSATAADRLAEAAQTADRAGREHVDAAIQVQTAGGADLQRQAERVATWTQAVIDRGTRLDRMRTTLASVGVVLPENASDFAELQVMAARERGELDAAMARQRRVTEGHHDVRAAAEKTIREVDSAVRELRARRTNIEPPLLRARAAIAAAMGLPEEVFRFAGELLDVDRDFADWEGAIQRVLRPLATTLLVRDEHLDDFTRVVDARHLDVRLVFESVSATSPAPRPTRSGRSLVHRVEIDESAGAAVVAWMSARLVERFDYECVESPAELHGVERGVTRAGQVKHGDRRFEKDDRSTIDDRARWSLGTDNAAKIDALLDSRREAEARKAAANDDIARGIAERSAADKRIATLQTLDGVPWSDLDTDAAALQAAAEQAALDRLRSGNADLSRAQDREIAARLARTTAESELRSAQSTLDRLAAETSAVEKRIAGLQTAEPEWSITETSASELDRLYRQQGRAQDREQILTTTATVQKHLHGERTAAENGLHRAIRDYEATATAFIRSWPAVASELTPSIDDRAGFQAILETIIASRLPEFETRFFDLLRDQSRQLVGQLLHDIRSAPAQVRSRVQPINESLLRSPYDEGRHLQIVVKERRTDEVREFMNDLQLISAGTWDGDDGASAEARFERLERVMSRLGAADDRPWRRRVLDTREHVTFVALEIDLAGREVNRHDSASGLSGGQRQKLVVFCLAAALRYQLAEGEDDVPRYGTIILDEAFDKADSAFTRMAMDVFVEFGFHMILATPLKLLQTLESYVGGVTFVASHDHHDSRLSAVVYEEDGS